METNVGGVYKFYPSSNGAVMGANRRGPGGRLALNAKGGLVPASALPNLPLDTPGVFASRMTVERPFFCHVCMKCFGSRASLSRHIRCAHSKNSLQCRYCTKTFDDQSKLQAHEQTHTDERAFECKVCKRRFRQKSSLTKHMRIHTDSKPFACLYCSKSFNVKSNLRTHVRTHTGEKPFRCEFPGCGKGFCDRSNMNKHVRLHMNFPKKYKCDLCNRSFAQACNMQRHRRGHTGQRPFKCHVCFKTFSRKTGLNRHLEKQHPGAPPIPPKSATTVKTTPASPETMRVNNEVVAAT